MLFTCFILQAWNNLKEKELLEKKKETKFAEKIDELNQETDILLEEVDKWQMWT